MGRTIAFGDIHGCLAALDAILAELEPQADDTLIFLGDYIDRGPDSAGVVSRVIGLREVCNVVALQGNHEAMLLMGMSDESQMEFWQTYGGKETVESYGGSVEDIPESHLEFFKDCLLYHETEKHFFVHANFIESIPLEKQQEYVLQWEHLNVHTPGTHVSGKRAVVGHTPQPDGEVLVLDSLICIDTHCYGKGYLTALDIDEESIWQASKDGAMRGEEEA